MLDVFCGIPSKYPTGTSPICISFFAVKRPEYDICSPFFIFLINMIFEYKLSTGLSFKLLFMLLGFE